MIIKLTSRISGGKMLSTDLPVLWVIGGQIMDAVSCDIASTFTRNTRISTYTIRGTTQPCGPLLMFDRGTYRHMLREMFRAVHASYPSYQEKDLI